MNPVLQEILHNITTRLAALEESAQSEKLLVDLIQEQRAEIDRLRQALAQPEQSKYSDIVSDGGLDPRNKFDAQPEQFAVSFPSFMRKRIEQALTDAINPKGMSVHDGKVKVLVSDLHRMLLVIDSTLQHKEEKNNAV